MGLCDKNNFFTRLFSDYEKRLTWRWEVGNGTNIRLSATPIPKSDCIGEIVNVSAVLLAILSSIILLICYKFDKKKKSNISLLPFHTCRTVLNILLFLFFIFELCESILISNLLESFFGTLATISCWAVHRQTELRNGVGVSVTGGAFATIAVSRIWRLFRLRRRGLKIIHVRAITTSGTAACCGLLALLDTYTLYRIIQKSKRYLVREINDETSVSYKHNISPFLSKITFHWIICFLIRGYRKPLNIEDLGKLPETESAEIQFEKFQQIYENEKKQKKTESPSLWQCFWKYVWPAFIIGGILKLFGDATTLISPFVISKIIDYVAITQNTTQNSRKPEYEHFIDIYKLLENGYFLGILMFLVSILQSTMSQTSTHVLNVEGIRLRTALQVLIYDKALKLSSWNISDEDATKQKMYKCNNDNNNINRKIMDVGTFTNLMAEDTYNIMGFFWIAHYTWAIPLKISVIIIFLYSKLGISAIFGSICCILAVTPLQLIIGKKMSQNSKIISEHSDARLRLLNEILQGMRLIKLRAWEDLFEKRIQKTREEELRSLDKDSIYWALITFLTYASSILTTLFTFGIYYLIEDRHLDTNSVFTSLALFSQLNVPLFIFPVIIPIIISAMTSTKRIEKYLSLSEVVDVILNKMPMDDKNGAFDDIVNDMNINRRMSTHGTLKNIEEEEIHDGNVFQIVNDEQSFSDATAVNINGIFSLGPETLKQLTINNLSFPLGKLTIIVGKTGSGKSSLLLAILEEIHKVSGNIEWTRNVRIAYVAQKPWLLNTTLRENILFGLSYRPMRYRNVLRACALQPDVNLLPGRDLTRIGEKGINLSGGQKQRVAIARAIYSYADIIILDDPLSALDQHVGQQVFENGIKELLLDKGRTVIMTTHKMELLSFAHQIVAMENCQIRAAGNKTEIELSDPELTTQWKQCIAKQMDGNCLYRTAKDRWKLIKLVSRIGISNGNKQASDGSWITDQDVHVTPPNFMPLKLRRSTLFGSMYLAHDLTDLPVPTDDLDQSSVFTKQLRRHVDAFRTTSLQPRKQQPPPVLRQSSTPTILERCYISKRIRQSERHSQSKCHSVKKLLSKECSTSQSTKDINISTSKNINCQFHQQVKGNQFVEKNECSASFKDWLIYLKTCGIVSGVFYITTALACQIVRIYTDIWLSRWTETNNSIEYPLNGEQDALYFYKVYMCLSLGTIILSALSNSAGQWSGARARKKLHSEAIAGLFTTQLSFFECTPVGRTLNRFSVDIGVIDKKLSTAIQRLTSFILLCSSAILINIVISPWFLFPVVPICAFYYFIQKFYRQSARELQKLDATTRGPVAAHFSETLIGLPTLRASKQQSRFMHQMMQHLDTNTNAFLMMNTSSRWLGIALDYLGAVIVLTSVIAVLISSELYPKHVSPALVGLSINYTLLVPVYLNWVVKFISEVEIYMGSVLRISDFAKLPHESKENEYNIQEVPKNWPSVGEIRFDNVSLQYDTHQEPIVRGFNLYIPGGQKLGICGRTGSGKSSTAMALMGLLKVSHGRIIIDGIDLRTVPLKIIRSRVYAIPQDIIMFSGTIRDNLDPLTQYSDNELWKALDLAQVKDIISTHPEKLNLKVREGGENFSAGQLGLLNMAAALLRQSSIVILDETTSALDVSTERSLLVATHEIFKNKTVITIAHRAAALMVCERIIVLDDGRIVEDGAPKDLILHSSGFFSTMLKDVKNIR